MRINAEIMSTLIKTQEEKAKESEFFNNNKFLLFSLALLTKTSTVINALINETPYQIEEIQSYISTLTDLELYTPEDKKVLERISKAKEKQNFTNEMEEILLHLSKLNKRSFSLNAVREKRLKVLLENGFTVRDFKAVNLYFTKTWGSDSSMKKYVKPETLYNTKFESRLEDSRAFFDTFNLYQEDINKLCDKFHKLLEIEIYHQNKLLSSDIGKDLCNELPLALQNTIIHWLESYDIDTIINTIENTILAWEKHYIYKNHISISKILDNRFPERVIAVRRKLENNEHPFKKEIQDIKNHFNIYKEFSFSEKLEERIKDLLNNLYKVEDFKLINTYFYKKWFKNIKHSELFSPNVLYSEDFLNKVNEAKNFKSKIEKYDTEINQFFKKFYNRIEGDIDAKTYYEYMPLKTLERLINVLNNHSIDEVIKVCENSSVALDLILIKYDVYLDNYNKRIEKEDLKNNKEITEVLDNLRKYSEYVTDDSNDKIKTLLKDYKVTDLKLVNLYFHKAWGKNGQYAQYIRPSTLYNPSKFEERFKTAKIYKENYEKHKDSIYTLFNQFETIFRKVDLDMDSKDLFKALPVQTVNAIIIWLEKYDLDTIIHTIKNTILAWEKHDIYKKYIFIHKILDEKFPERVLAVKKKEGFVMKDSYNKLVNWAGGAE